MATAAPTNGKRKKLEVQPQPHPHPQQLEYLSGFGNHFATEAIPGALPQGQNTPQVCSLGKLTNTRSRPSCAAWRFGRGFTTFLSSHHE